MSGALIVFETLRGRNGGVGFETSAAFRDTDRAAGRELELLALCSTHSNAAGAENTH